MKKMIAVLSAALCITVPVRADASVETARSICVINASTGETVFEKNSRERLPMASTTKIMTAYTAIKNSSMNELVTVSRNAQDQEGSSMYVRAGEQLAMEDMIYGLMLNSGNDAAVAIAEHISGSSDSFAELMNRTAKELGVSDTHFCNPNGLPSDDHFTTAAELAYISREAFRLPEFCRIVSEQAHTAHTTDGRAVELYNHNKLLGRYEGAVGIKTGYTKAAGRCLVSAAQRDGMTFIAVTLNDSDDWNTHMELLDAAFDAHYPKQVLCAGEVLKECVKDGRKCTFSAAEDLIVPMKKNEKQNVEVTLHFADVAGAINKGEKIGFASVSCGGNKVGEVDIISDSDIPGEDPIQLYRSFGGCLRSVWEMLMI